ncbi:Asp-tRNA(Asn)/Glu-tRNA(Gln) amidotransferase subunit GatC [bacterium]|nr:Asp-tRNA(Asn)/Glu-tRNA(Gln) amidotransferase subunit GatC [bacterium]
MPVSHAEILKIAKLAKLEFSEKNLEKLSKDLNNILNYVELLKEIDTENIETLDSIHETGNVLRKDEILSSLSKENALTNAPETQNGFFKVPKVVQEGN